jgi:hypothetical protein
VETSQQADEQRQGDSDPRQDVRVSDAVWRMDQYQ